MRGKKLCGILVEAGFTGGGTLDYAVLGIGVNLRFDPAAHPELADIAGGLADFTTREFGHADLAAAILRELDRVYALLCAGDTAAILDEYRAHLLGIGETITVHGTDDPWQATCVGLDAQGHLLVEDARGQHVLSTGEISIRLAEQKNAPANLSKQ
jgi:BirA family biotin operon repressor/biotin-[acetyl-CoA-carboxylase] ligase